MELAMLRYFQIIGLLAVAHAFAPGPIRWSGIPAKRFVLVPAISPSRAAVPSSAMVRHQILTLSDEQPLGRIASSVNPYFRRQSDKTIRDSTGLCVEANGYNTGDAIRVNQCTGSAMQLWNVLPSGQALKKWIQLQGSNKCLDVNFEREKDNLEGVQIQLGECGDKASELWTFEEAMPLQVETSSPRRAPSSGMSQPTIIFHAFAILVGLGLGVHLWRRLWSHGSNTPLSQADLGGVAMSAPLPRYQNEVPFGALPARNPQVEQTLRGLNLVAGIGAVVTNGEGLHEKARQLELVLFRILRTEPDWNLFAEDVIITDPKGSKMDLWTFKMLLKYTRKFAAKLGLKEEIKIKSTVFDSDAPKVEVDGKGSIRGIGLNIPVPFRTEVDASCTVRYNSKGKIREILIERWRFNSKSICLPPLRAIKGQEEISMSDKAVLWAWGTKALIPPPPIPGWLKL